MTKLEFINKIFFQWLFIRLTKVYSISTSGEKTFVKYTLQGVIVPLTGWNSDFKCLSNGYVDLTPLFFVLLKIHFYGLFVFSCIPDIIDTYGRIFLSGFIIELLNELHGKIKSIHNLVKFIKENHGQ